MTVVFLAWLTLLEGRPGAVSAVVQAKLLPIMVANFGVWPLAHLINFKFVAPEQRILFNNVVAGESLSCQSKQKTSSKPTNQPTNH
jgi:protein Mpv17